MYIYAVFLFSNLNPIVFQLKESGFLDRENCLTWNHILPFSVPEQSWNLSFRLFLLTLHFTLLQCLQRSFWVGVLLRKLSSSLVHAKLVSTLAIWNCLSSWKHPPLNSPSLSSLGWWFYLYSCWNAPCEVLHYIKVSCFFTSASDSVPVCWKVILWFIIL